MTHTWRIVTYNTWKCDGLYRDRLEWMGQGLRALAPDILCLQEAFDCPERGADTARYFSDVLGMSVEVLSARRKHRVFENDNRMSGSNLAILSKWPMLRQPDVKLAEHSEDADRWAMQVSIPTGLGWGLRIVNTHFTHLRGASGKRVRASQAEQVSSVCQAQERETVVLCGDLNDEWESDALAPMRQLEWLNIQHDLDGSTWLGQRKSSNVPERRIDQVQVMKKHAQDVDVLRRFPALNTPVGPAGEYPSDHAALVVDLELRQSRREAA